MATTTTTKESSDNTPNSQADTMVHAPKTGEEKLQDVWQKLIAKQKDGSTVAREWPSYDTVMASTISSDYNEILKCPLDFLKRNDGGGNNRKTNNRKTISPHGVVCRARLELFSNHHTTQKYTGALAPGTTWNHCLLRLSSCMQPPTEALSSSIARSVLYATGDKLRKAQLFPASALKAFLNDGSDGSETPIPSKNLLFAGSKIGQRETDYFAHCQATSMTERMPYAIKPFVRKFWEYSDYPLSLGVSDFCQPIHNNEQEDEELNFPFAVILKPCIRSTPCEGDDDGENSGDEDEDESKIKRRCSEMDAEKSDGGLEESDAKPKRSWSKWASFPSFSVSSNKDTTEETGSFDSFLDFCLNQIPVETQLFDVYTCPTPQDVADPSRLQRIGRIVTTSTFISSSPDDGLFFKHQAKEEDYALRPEWPKALQEPVTSLDGGKVKGTVGTLAGWKLFQQQIAKKKYVDFEQQSATVAS